MATIECVPNISEGRRPDVVDAITAAVRDIAHVRVLDVASDASHNRTVLTLAGDGDSLRDAIVALYTAALPLIDLRTQHGQHPRLGAVDVVPFVPLGATTLDACVALAKAVGATIAAQFDLPVFLYEAAATTPARRNLADIRRGEFEGLAARLASAEWAPDFGPARPHPSAGATVIGARMPLIAFNVNLRTNRLDVAKAIAAAVRTSSGGLPCVKALGIDVREQGIVQVSMNLTNYLVTPLETAFEAVRSHASALGTDVLDSEIVGLIPAAAVPESVGTLRLRGFREDQVLETRLANPDI